MNIVIIDYGAGNIQSIKNAVSKLGYSSIVTKDKNIINNASKIIFPGVGAFGDMMNSLKNLGLIDTIKKNINSGKPFLGICLGLQALFEESEESPGVKGLGIFKGKVLKFRGIKSPQIGWNLIKCCKKNKLINEFEKKYFYFVHSYYVVPFDEEIILTKTNYSIDFVSSINKDNIYAFQFHPEKSGKDGLELLKRFLEC